MEIINPMPMKEKKRIGRAPRHTDEYYMVMAKEVVEEGLSYRAAGTKYSCSHGTVAHWSKLYREGKLGQRIEKNRKSSTKLELQLQRQERYIKELKAQVGELYLENQLLKKAQDYFRTIRNDPSSLVTSGNLVLFREDAE